MQGPYKRYVEAVFKRLEGGGDDSTREEIQVAMQEALLDHVAWRMDSEKGKPLPQEMAFELSIYFRDIIAGHPNQYTTPIVKKPAGRHKRHPDENSCIEDAVRYLRFVDDGLIKDRHPIKTVHEHYGGTLPMGGLDKRTVRRWKTFKQFDHIQPDKTEPDLIVAKMKFSGRYYRSTYTQFGRAMERHDS